MGYLGRFGDAVQEVDNVIGSIYAEVVKAGIANNTLTFFTADNGPWLQKKLAGGSAGIFRYLLPIYILILAHRLYAYCIQDYLLMVSSRHGKVV